MSKVWYGSLMNRLQEKSEGIAPEVGMGVTEMCYSDRHPYEVTEVIDDRHIKVRRLDSKRIDGNGMSECQEYEYASNPDNHEAKLFLTKQGKWRERLPDKTLGNNIFRIGYAEEYYDFSF